MTAPQHNHRTCSWLGDVLTALSLSGTKTATDPQDMRAWLRLLVGQYTYEGYVDLCGNGNAIKGACEKVIRISVRPDGNEISMVTDVNIDSHRVLRQDLPAPSRQRVATMKYMRVLCLMLACTTSATSSAVHAQARPAAPDPPVVPQIKSPPPCSNWGGEVTRTICLARIRSSAFARAWTGGADEQGVRLDAAMQARKMDEMETWLRRLGGKYHVEGSYSNSGGSNPVRGTAQCLGIGDGPAAPCVITATWKAPKEANKDVALDKALYKALQGMVLLFGTDPDASKIRVTMMDYRAVRMSGFLIDGAAVFDGETAMHVFPANRMQATPNNPLVPYFWSHLLVAITPDNNVVIKIQVTFADGMNFLAGLRRRQPSIELDLHLRRERP